MSIIIVVYVISAIVCVYAEVRYIFVHVDPRSKVSDVCTHHCSKHLRKALNTNCRLKLCNVIVYFCVTFSHRAGVKLTANRRA
jgi:hypothetical protein